ncbi:MAG: hypothetical protein CYPHOPRED_001536 [Cyphobasidiales sp. Tagirdzhanova-0007]|nr:MAG: hypothetical protein CYPHOPRED_001536 [Cyphobasidiales sp. Tagirdzhanova-0007]
MRLLRVLSSIVLLSSFAQAHPLSNPQTVFDSFDHGLELEFGASHLSEWCALSKRKFLKAVRDDDASEWTVVMGNEAGDLDSMVSAIAYAYDISHLKHGSSKAVALLQVEAAAIDLRPENKLALTKAGMARGHKDLLTLEELPVSPNQIGAMIKGLILVDHNKPLSVWEDTPILGVIDHHHDFGTNLTASPRLIEPAGSCSSLVTSLILGHKHSHGPIPRSLGDLILYAIAIDTKGLKKGLAIDRASAEAIFPHSHYSEEDFQETLKDLAKVMKKAKNDLDDLTLTQLIQRDWKGDIVKDSTVPVHLGFASIPMSFADMIKRTPNDTLEAFFEIDNDWAHQNKVDIAILLTSFKDSEKVKHREIILTVRAGHRIDEAEAERLFNDVKRDIEASPCKEVIEALEECHKIGWRKYFGQCNQLKHDLNMCLRSERFDRREKNHEEAKARRSKAEKVWKEIDEES